MVLVEHCSMNGVGGRVLVKNVVEKALVKWCCLNGEGGTMLVEWVWFIHSGQFMLLKCWWWNSVG